VLKKFVRNLQSSFLPRNRKNSQ
jgi:hypothetical protein